MSKKIYIIISFIVTLTFLGLLVYGLTQTKNIHVIPTVLRGKKATPFSITTFKGEKISLAQFQGKPVILNFWASWCIACREEAHILETSYEKWKDKDVVFIGVAINDKREDSLAFIKKYGKTYRIGADNAEGTISLNYGVTAVPETFLIDKKGIIVDKVIGAVAAKQLDSFLEKHLPKS